MTPIPFSAYGRQAQVWIAALVLLVSSAVGALFWSFSHSKSGHFWTAAMVATLQTMSETDFL